MDVDVRDTGLFSRVCSGFRLPASRAQVFARRYRKKSQLPVRHSIHRASSTFEPLARVALAGISAISLAPQFLANHRGSESRNFGFREPPVFSPFLAFDFYLCLSGLAKLPRH